MVPRHAAITSSSTRSLPATRFGFAAPRRLDGVPGYQRAWGILSWYGAAVAALTDPERTTVILVTRPDRVAQEERGRAALAAMPAAFRDLAARAAAELEQIVLMRTTLATRIAVVPWLAEEPLGADRPRHILQPVSGPAG